MTTQSPSIRSCDQCGTPLSFALLACPKCGRLVHGERLRALAAAAEDATRRGDVVGALTQWREALDLLPEGSRQREVITQKINVLSEQVRSGVLPPPPPPPPGSTQERSGGGGLKGALVGAGAIALLLWKFKFVVAFLLTKGKLLLLGLTKASTFFSMFLAMGVYWSVWGWKFALGVVLSIYIHEMGHVVALSRYGLKATPPMFLPGLGAVVRSKHRPTNPRENADVSLAGPIYGVAAAAAAFALWHATDQAVLAAIAQIGAVINLFNLTPVFPLDGNGAFGAMSRNQRWLAALSVAVAWYLTAEGMLVLLLLVAVVRALPFRSTSSSSHPDDAGDVRTTVQYVVLVGILSLMSEIRVPVPQ